MMYRNILFDFDGTLADTREGIILTVLATLKEMGLPAARPDDVAATIGLPLTECFRQATEAPEDRIEEAAAVYRRLFPEVATEHIALFDSVEKTLGRLAEEGVRMAVASSRHRISLDPLTERLGITQFIAPSRVYGEDSRLRPKPAPDLALKIMADLGLAAAETLVVGDTVYDLQMGADAGCRTCGVTYGNQSRAQLAAAAPDHLIDRLAELLTL